MSAVSAIAHPAQLPALARRDTRQRNRGSNRDLSGGQRRGASDDTRSGSIKAHTH